MRNIQTGDKVRCKRGSIDKNAGAGLVGTVGGLARFSSYHGREAFVHFGKALGDADNRLFEPHAADGWFWLIDVELETAAVAA